MRKTNASNEKMQYHFGKPDSKRKIWNFRQGGSGIIGKTTLGWMWFAVFLVVQSLILSGCSKEESIQEIKGNSQISVEIQKITPRTLAGKLSCFGVLESVNEVIVNVDFPAPVAKVMVREGQRVRKGELLLRFDTTKLELKYQQTKAALSQEMSTLENHSITKKRIENLLKSGAVSQQAADDARSAYKTTLGRVKESQNGLKLLKRDLEHSNVHSPIDAIVNSKMVEVGQNTIAYQPLILLDTTKSLNVSVYVGESAVPFLRIGSPAIVNTVAGTLESKIYSIGAKSDPQTGNFEVKLLIDNTKGVLKPGMTADVELSLLAMENRLVIPQTALSGRYGRYVVFRVVDGLARQTEVEVSMDYKDRILVTRGLAGGETLIVNGADKVRDGAPVKVKNE